MAEVLRHCRYEKLKAFDPCEPYKTRLHNGMEIYCPRCRAHAHRWMNEKQDVIDRYGDRLRYNSVRLQTWTTVAITTVPNKKGVRRGS